MEIQGRFSRAGLIQKISYNLGIATLSRLVTGGISLVIIGFLTRHLGPSGYGQYNSIFAYLFIFTALADLGLYTVLVREISKRGADEVGIASKIFTLRLFSIIAVIFLADILVFVFPYTLAVKIGILIASTFAIFSSLTQVLTGIFQKHLRLYLVSLADVISRIAQLAVLAPLIYLKAGLIWFIWAVVFGEIVHFFLVFIFSRPLVRVKFAADFKYWGELFKITFPIAVSLVFVLIYFKLDTVLLSIMKPAYDVGVYSVAYKILEAVIFLPAIYIGLVMPILSKHAFDNREGFIKVFKKAFNVLSIFALYFSAYFFLFANSVIKIIGGSGFVQSSPVLKILSLAIFLIFFGNLGGNAIIALNLQKKALWIYFVGAIFNLGTNLIFIPGYSYFATAWTTVLTELLITIWMFWLIKKETQVKIEVGVLLKAVASILITAMLIIPFGNNFILASLISLSYYPILFLLKGFSKEDIMDIISLKKSPELSGEIES